MLFILSETSCCLYYLIYVHTQDSYFDNSREILLGCHNLDHASCRYICGTCPYVANLTIIPFDLFINIVLYFLSHQPCSAFKLFQLDSLVLESVIFSSSNSYPFRILGVFIFGNNSYSVNIVLKC